MGLPENRGYPQMAMLTGKMLRIHWNSDASPHFSDVLPLGAVNPIAVQLLLSHGVSWSEQLNSLSVVHHHHFASAFTSIKKLH